MEDFKTHLFGLLKTLGIAAIGILLAYLLSALIGDDVFGFAGSTLLSGFLFAGVPFGWLALQSILGFISGIGEAGPFIYFALMLIFSFMIGWAILLWNLCKDIFGLIVSIISLAKARR